MLRVPPSLAGFPCRRVDFPRERLDDIFPRINREKMDHDDRIHAFGNVLVLGFVRPFLQVRGNGTVVFIKIYDRFYLFFYHEYIITLSQQHY